MFNNLKLSLKSSWQFGDWSRQTWSWSDRKIQEETSFTRAKLVTEVVTEYRNQSIIKENKRVNKNMLTISKTRIRMNPLFISRNWRALHF